MTLALAAALALIAGGSTPANFYRGPDINKAFPLEPGRMVSQTRTVYDDGGSERVVREDIRYDRFERGAHWFFVITSSDLKGYEPLSIVRMAVNVANGTRYLGQHTKLAVQIEHEAEGQKPSVLRVLSHSYKPCEGR